jgi:hypothetical protein
VNGGGRCRPGGADPQEPDRIMHRVKPTPGG